MILETFEKVFFEAGNTVALMGSTVKNIDMTALTLHKIKKTVEKIDRKVSKQLRAPLLNAIDHFNEVIDYFLSKKYEKAYDTIDKVLNNATDAFNKISDKNIDMETFADCVKSVQLLVFSKLIRESYDNEQKIFLPFSKLSQDTKDVISRFIIRNVDKCITLKDNVNIPILTFDKEKKRSTIQNMLDSILQFAYPYISQANKWTDFENKIQEDNLVSFKVNARYLPMGVEDRTEVVVGSTKSEFVRFFLWRDENTSYASYGGLIVKVEYNSEKLEIVECTLPKYFILSSSNTVKYIGHAVIGQYEFVEGNYKSNGNYERLHYRQMGDVSFCLYYVYEDEKKIWYGNRTWYGSTKKTILYNPNQDPRDGWKFNGMEDSAILTLTPGLLPACKLRVTLTGDGAENFDKCPGDFSAKNAEWSFGKPIYTNCSGCYLWFKDGSWRFTSSSGDARLVAYTNEDVICPASIPEWKWTSDVHHHVEVSIACHNH